MNYQNLKLAELKELCKNRGLSPKGHQGHKKTFITALESQDLLDTHDIQVETVSHECEGKVKDFPTYTEINQTVASTCATCPAWTWRGFTDGSGWCKARDCQRNGNASYSSTHCDYALEKWEIENKREELERVYESSTVADVIREKWEEKTPTENPRKVDLHTLICENLEKNKALAVEYEDITENVMTRQNNGYIFAVYIGVETEEIGKFMLKHFRQLGMTNLTLRRSKRIFTYDWEIRILKPRFEVLDYKRERHLRWNNCRTNEVSKYAIQEIEFYHSNLSMDVYKQWVKPEVTI